MRYDMSGKLHLICMKTKVFQAKIRCNLIDILYLIETQKNQFLFLNELQITRLYRSNSLCKRLNVCSQDVSMIFFTYCYCVFPFYHWI